MASFFIRRPIVAMVIAILMVLMGIVAMRRLPTAQFPNIAPPEIQVKATYREPMRSLWNSRLPRQSSSK